MGRKATTRIAAGDAARSLSVAKAVAPEDLRRGDFVAVLSETREFPAFLFCTEAWGAEDGMLRCELAPEEAGEPLRVKQLCLPFVMVRRPTGAYQTLDVRRCRLARLDGEFARASWKVQRAKPSSGRKGRRRKRRRNK